MKADGTMIPPLATVLEQGLERASEEARAIWQSGPPFGARDEQTLHRRWEYEKRLRFLQVFAAMTDPCYPVDPAALSRIEARFRDALVAYGSATEDNLHAARAVSLKLKKSEDGAGRLSLHIEGTSTDIHDIVLELCDTVGTAEFYNRHLRGIARLEHLTPENWENAYRVIMLAVCALFASPIFAERKDL